MRESWQAVVCLPLMELSPAPVLAPVFMDPLARSPIGVPVPQAIRGPVVSGPIIARIGVGGRVRVGSRVVAVAVPWIGVGRRIVAVPRIRVAVAIVGRIAVAIVGTRA